jgi:hypothetical protein
MRQIGRVGLPVVEGDVGPEITEDVKPPGRDRGAGQVPPDSERTRRLAYSMFEAERRKGSTPSGPTDS